MRNRSLRRNPWLLAAVCLAGAVPGAAPCAARGQDPAFTSEVAPVLVRRCLACHGEQKFRGGYQVHSLAAVRTPGESGEPAVVPGKPADSHLLHLLTTEDAGSRMPKDAPPLPAAEIDAIRRWIAAGAEDQGVDPQAALVNLVRWQHPAPPDAYARPFPVTALAFSPDGSRIAAGGLNEVTLWSTADGTLQGRLPGLAERTYALLFLKDGQQLLTASGTPGHAGEVKLLAAPSGELLRHYGSLADCALSVAVSPDGQLLAVGGADAQVRLFEVATGKVLHVLTEHADWVHGVAFSPDGAKLATASRDRTCKVFDSRSGGLITTYTDHAAAVFAVAFSADGKYAVSGGGDGRVHVWLADDPGWENPEKQDKKKRHQVASLQGFSGPLHQLAVSGSQVLACSADRSARLFDLEKKSLVRSFAGHQAWPCAVAWHPASNRGATAGLDGQVRLWDTQAKEEKDQLVLSFIAAPGYQPPAAEK